MTAPVRYLRYIAEGGAQPRFGVLADDTEEILELDSDPIRSTAEPTGTRRSLDSVRLLAPVAAPSKIIGIGKNYAEHAREMGGEAPEKPIVFLKAPSSLLDPGGTILRPAWSKEVHHEGELAVIIAKRCKDLAPEQAGEAVFGYTIANDVTARDAQRSDGQWTRAKGFDTSCPLGPWILVDPELDVEDLRVTTRVDGLIRQDDTTAHMLTPVTGLIAYVSSMFALEPGDIILSGTPAGVGPIEAGQRVEVAIEGIGVLANGVADQP